METSTEIIELQNLLNNLPQAKIDQATRDLHFDWSDIDNLKSGQVSVLLRRLRQSARKSPEEVRREVYNSSDMRSMRKLLKQLQNKLRNNEQIR